MTFDRLWANDANDANDANNFEVTDTKVAVAPILLTRREGLVLQRQHCCCRN